MAHKELFWLTYAYLLQSVHVAIFWLKLLNKLMMFTVISIMHPIRNQAIFLLNINVSTFNLILPTWEPDYCFNKASQSCSHLIILQMNPLHQSEFHWKFCLLYNFHPSVVVIWKVNVEVGRENVGPSLAVPILEEFVASLIWKTLTVALTQQSFILGL